MIANAIRQATGGKAAPAFMTAEFDTAASKALTGKPYNTKEGIACLLAHMAVESNGFKAFAENMNYSAARLPKVWPSRFNSSNAKEFANNPQKLAAKVYDGRMGNAPYPSTDGWVYRGSGLLQHTGKSEHATVFTQTGVTSDQLRDPKQPAAMLRAAINYVERRAVGPSLASGDMQASTRKINGGLTGFEDRVIWRGRFAAALKNEKPVSKSRTTQERQTTAAKIGKAGVGAGGVTGGGGVTAGTVAPAPKQVSPASSGMPEWAIGGAVAIGVALIAFGAWKLMHANKMQIQIDKDAVAIADARAAMSAQSEGA
jgi:putative chitinase